MGDGQAVVSPSRAMPTLPNSTSLPAVRSSGIFRPRTIPDRAQRGLSPYDCKGRGYGRLVAALCIARAISKYR